MISWEQNKPQHLAPGEIHLWAGKLNQDSLTLQKLKACLSYGELGRASRFRFERDQNYFIVGRAMLRQVLGPYLEVSPSRLEFSYAAQGKPYLSDFPALHFNLSHSGEMALLGLTQLAPLGVDLEDTRREIEFDMIARHFFSPAEVEDLLALAPSQRAEGFYNCWTRKESFIKALGDGLSFPLDQFEVSLGPEAAPVLRATHWDTQEKRYWSLGSLNPAPGYTGAWAVREKVQKVLYAQWEAY